MKTKFTACPKCGGPLTSWIGFRAGMIYKCKKCDYRGPVALRLKSKKEFERLKK